MKISLIITAIILIIQIIIRPDSVYISDPLVKAIQVKSLFLNGWNSQDIFYPAKEYDPLFTMNPLNEGFIFFNKGRFIGQYPIALSFFYSIILFLGFSLLPYLNSLILFPMVFLYSKNLYNKNNLFYLLFGTTIIVTIIDFRGHHEYSQYHIEYTDVLDTGTTKKDTTYVQYKELEVIEEF